MFAVTPRGAALINRIKADPTLRQSEIRVIAHNSDYVRVVPRAAPPAAPALDQRGTRRAARFKMTPNTQAIVDDKHGHADRSLERRRAGGCKGGAEAEPADYDDPQR